MVTSVMKSASSSEHQPDQRQSVADYFRSSNNFDGNGNFSAKKTPPPAEFLLNLEDHGPDLFANGVPNSLGEQVGSSSIPLPIGGARRSAAGLEQSGVEDELHRGARTSKIFDSIGGGGVGAGSSSSSSVEDERKSQASTTEELFKMVRLNEMGVVLSSLRDRSRDELLQLAQVGYVFPNTQNCA